MTLPRGVESIVLLGGLLMVGVSSGANWAGTVGMVNVAGQVTSPQVAATVEDGDQDDDGVPDLADVCPGTVPGSPVNPFGCPPVILGDFDRDGDVDPSDFSVFEPCAAGPAVAIPAGCLDMDLDWDMDVDQSDFGIFQRCYSGSGIPADPSCIVYGARIAKTWKSDCLPGNPPLWGDGDDYPWCGKDELEVTVQGRLLRLIHRHATYNCCPDDIQVTLDAQGSFLCFQEKELLTMGCHCLCCYDVATDVEVLKPGVYRIEYCWLDDDNGYMCLTEDVTVGP